MTKQIVLVVVPPMVPLTPVVAQPDLSFIEGSTDRERLPQSFDLGDSGLENQVAYFLSSDRSELQDGDIVLGIDVALATEDDNSMMAAEVAGARLPWRAEEQQPATTSGRRPPLSPARLEENDPPRGTQRTFGGSSQQPYPGVAGRSGSAREHTSAPRT